MLTLADVAEAAQALRGVTLRTPVLRSDRLDELAGAELFVKAENLQRTGSFKLRGAYNRCRRLSAEELRAGIVAASSGNHAQAVALSARLLGTTALILMPEDTPSFKLEATRSLGAEIVAYDRYAQDRDEVLRGLVTDSGRTYVPPYDHPLVMAGQGTVAMELLEDVPDLDVLVAPVSGGGLMAGCATTATALRPGIVAIGVEPAAGDDTARSLRAGRRVRIPVPRTIADGLQIEVPGELTFEVNRRLIDEMATVVDDDIVAAMRTAFETLKVVAEPSGAAALAAVLSGAAAVAGRRVGVVISGGNIGAGRFAELVGA